MTSPEPTPDRPASADGVRLLAAAGVLAVVSAATWWAFLGWDHEYYLVDGVPQGPYRAWQVLGCGASIVVASVVAYLWVRSSSAIVVLAAAATIGFAVPWAIDASATDDSGLWAVGLVFLLVGAGTGLVVVLAICSALPSRSRPIGRSTT